MKNFKFILIAIVAMLFSTATVEAQESTTLKLPSVVGSNMVLQHSTTVNIWGWAKPNGKVKVVPSWLNNKKGITVKADSEGFWITQVQTLAAGFDAHTITIKAGKDTEVLENILFGEVWLCAGQSNMEWPVRKTPDMRSELEAGTNNNIRLYSTGRIASATPMNEVPKQKGHKTKWSVCDANSLKKFSAVGYGFGKDLQEALNVPIGLIDASYGGTPVEGWLSADALLKDAKLAALAKKSKNKKWGKKISHLHNANIYPIRHTTIAGVIWYQGCSNVNYYNTYRRLLNGLIKSWREEFRNPNMPFYIVEIAPHTYLGTRGAHLREAQARVAASNSNCELVVTNDQNHIPGDIHPPKKWDVAHRLAQCALGAHYNKSDKVFRSPAYKSMTIEGNTIRVEFDNVPTTLVQKGEGRINGFQLGVNDAENPKKLIFSVAEAKIEGKTVVVSAEGVENPVSVRYCFNEDMGNVFSAEGLPLRAFRSDKNESPSARPYVEKPSEIAVEVKGEGFTRNVYTKGSVIWPENPYTFIGELPSAFDGFEMMVPTPVEKGQTSTGGQIVAKGDGKVYILQYNNGALRKHGWNTLTQTYSHIGVNGKRTAIFYIYEREVKAGEVVEIPQIKNKWGVIVLAKTIE